MGRLLFSWRIRRWLWLRRGLDIIGAHFALGDHASNRGLETHGPLTNLKLKLLMPPGLECSIQIGIGIHPRGTLKRRARTCWDRDVDEACRGKSYKCVTFDTSQSAAAKPN